MRACVYVCIYCQSIINQRQKEEWCIIVSTERRKIRYDRYRKEDFKCRIPKYQHTFVSRNFHLIVLSKFHKLKVLTVRTIQLKFFHMRNVLNIYSGIKVKLDKKILNDNDKVEDKICMRYNHIVVCNMRLKFKRKKNRKKIRIKDMIYANRCMQIIINCLRKLKIALNR